MTRRGLMSAAVVALFVLAIGGFWSIYGTQRVTFTEAQVQERINAAARPGFSGQGSSPSAHQIDQSARRNHSQPGQPHRCSGRC